MSQILIKHFMIPNLSLAPNTWVNETFADHIDNTRLLDIDENKVELPDPKAFRSMTRAAVLLSSFIEPLKKEIQAQGVSPFEIGIYAAFENGPIDAASTAAILQLAPTPTDVNFAEAYRKKRNAKMYLKQLPNLAAAQIGIFLDIQGPMQVFTHSRLASIQALEKAEWDLSQNKVKLALVITAHVFEDYMVVKRSRMQDARTLCEGFAVVLLKQNEKFKNWKMSMESDTQNYFGISDPLINILRGETYV